MLSELFRRESMDAKNRWLGEIILIRPLSFTFFAAGSLMLIAAFVAFVSTADYTSRISLRGQLLPETGVISVDAPQSGIISSKNVVEGQAVNKGDLLYTLSSDRETSDQVKIQREISVNILQRKNALADELQKTLMLQKEAYVAARNKVTSLQDEERKLLSQIEKQEGRIELANDVLARYSGLVNDGFFSRQAISQKEVDLLDQRLKLDELQRGLLELRRQLNDANSYYIDLKQKNEIALSEMNRSLKVVQQEYIESEAKRENRIFAPQSGVATGVTMEAGQSVKSGQAMMDIVPAKSKLRAILYAKSKDVGLIETGRNVKLRFDSFSYTRFGKGSGTIVSISQTARPASELDALLPKDSVNNEPVYRVVVELNDFSISAHGKKYLLQSGMLIDADISLETRKIYQWIFEPLSALSESVK